MDLSWWKLEMDDIIGLVGNQTGISNSAAYGWRAAVRRSRRASAAWDLLSRPSADLRLLRGEYSLRMKSPDAENFARCRPGVITSYISTFREEMMQTH